MNELPEHICALPIRGWRLQSIEFDDGKFAKNDGWIVALQREAPSMTGGIRVVMARSGIGLLEAWDEALRIAQRDNERQAERAGEKQQ